jgi:DNA phosphorothioation-dependent restriction protein DptF
MEGTFGFLEEFEELYNKAMEFENRVKTDLSLAWNNARNFVEELSVFLLKQNNLTEFLSYANNERLKILEEKALVKADFLGQIDLFNSIAGPYNNPQEIDLTSIKVLHEVMFVLAMEIKEEYSSLTFDTEKYNSKCIEIFYSELSDEFKVNTVDIKEEEKLYNSYFLYQLAKLNDSSKEVIQNSKELDDFKNYLHVERKIQNDFEEKVLEVFHNNKCELILLCGSVGDGKSHLLAYMNENYSEIMDKFIIHNDATESFDPHKNSIETLAELLRPFSDKNIKYSSEKIVVAINLGVLNNFLESEFAKENYSELSMFIKNSKIFDEQTLSNNISEDSFHLISFSDYQMFELNKEGVSSNYFSSIFEKIVQQEESNPFYQAYLKDLNNFTNNPLLINYELFQRKEVRDFVIEILIKAIIKHKAIFSTRALFNFIYDILVPSNIEEKLEMKSGIDLTENLLPNLLFASEGKSALLKIINKFDPINIREVKIDEILIGLNNSINIKEFCFTIFKEGYLQSWFDSLKNLGAFYDLSGDNKSLINKTLIRLGRIVSYIDITEEDLVYKDYINYLYNYNIGDLRAYRHLFEEVKDAVFLWRGSPNSSAGSIYINESLDAIKVAQNLNVYPSSTNRNSLEEYRNDRFKNSITLAYEEKNSKDIAYLQMDYPLYLIIRSVLKGRRPSKKDKEEAIKFIEFIDKLIEINNNGEEVLVHHVKDKLTFKLKIDSVFGDFVFERE